MTRYLFSIVLVTVTMFLLKHSNKLHANAFRMTRSGANTAIMARRGAFSGNHLNMADETVRFIFLCSLHFTSLHLTLLHFALGPQQVLSHYH